LPEPQSKPPRRLSYKHALKAKGIRPLPKFDKLRSSHKGGACITANEKEVA
jgi:hypothetical protein